MKDQPGGVTLLVLNLSRTQAQTLKVAGKAMLYTLTAPLLRSNAVFLNGKELTLTADGDVPKLTGVASKSTLDLPAASIVFAIFAGVNNPACR
jgi:hypothetical protein